MADATDRQSQPPHLLPRVLSVAIVNGIGALLLLLLNYVLAKTIGEDGVGTYNYAWAWVEVMVVLSMLGLDKLAMRDVAYHVTHEAWDKLRGLLIGSSALLCISALISSVLIALVFYLFVSKVLAPVLLVAGLIGFVIIPFRAVTFHCYAILLGLHRSLRAQIPMFIGQPLFTVLIFIGFIGVFGLSQVTGVEAVVASLISAILVAVITLLLCVFALPREVRGVESKYEFSSWIQVSLPMMLLASMALINIRADIIMIGLLSHSDDVAAEVGVYTVASRFSELIRFGVLAVNPVIVGLIARHYASQQHDKLKQVVRTSARLLLLGALAGVLVLYLFGKPILSVFGAGFVAGYVPLLILAFGQFMTVSLGPVDSILIMTGHHKAAVVGLLIATAINLLLNAVLIPQFGMMGAAIATATSATIWSVILAVSVIKRLHFRPFAV